MISRTLPMFYFFHVIQRIFLQIHLKDLVVFFVRNRLATSYYNWGKMKIVKYIVVILIIVVVFGAALTSCGTAVSIQENSKELAGYTLKNKKELMQQKILEKKSKTIVATP